jgi:phosphoribosylformylglycinamidine cyclo-ligase
MRRYDTIGQDLVAMCADDVVCHGARPLAFLDYVATGRVEPLNVADLVAGVAHGCALAGCSLVGGETAEHPGLMRADEFDLAGFCLGVVERDELLDGRAAREGDAIIGLASSGFHANGYSLVRAMLAQADLDLSMPYLDVVRRALGPHVVAAVTQDEPGRVLATLGEVLLTPTRIHAADILALRDEVRGAGSDVRGIAHITGGGIHGNLPRAIPDDLSVAVDPRTWHVPSEMRVFAALGRLEEVEMRATFNAGIGIAVVIESGREDDAIRFLAGRGTTAWRIGDVVPIPESGARYIEVGV